MVRILTFRLLHIFLLLLSLPAAIWCVGILWFLLQIPADSPSTARKVDAIVVLTGGEKRLEHGLRLLQKGVGNQMLVSGVNPNVSAQEIFAAISPEKVNIYRKHKKRITLGKEAMNTLGNAQETAKWVEKHHIKSLRLVTAGYHMPRSLLELRRALPDTTIIPDPVFPTPFPGKDWQQHLMTLRFIITEYHKFLAAWLQIYHVA